VQGLGSGRGCSIQLAAEGLVSMVSNFNAQNAQNWAAALSGTECENAQNS
jgi:hypothetical protein